MQTKDLVSLQEIIDLISQYNKQDENDYIFLSFKKKGKGVSPDELNRILYVFSGVANCPLHEIICNSKKRPLPDYRAMIAFYLRELDMKLIDIAAVLKWNDHSTVVSAIEKHGHLYRYDKEYRQLYEKFIIRLAQ